MCIFQEEKNILMKTEKLNVIRELGCRPSKGVPQTHASAYLYANSQSRPSKLQKGSQGTFFPDIVPKEGGPWGGKLQSSTELIFRPKASKATRGYKHYPNLNQCPKSTPCQLLHQEVFQPFHNL